MTLIFFFLNFQNFTYKFQKLNQNLGTDFAFLDIWIGIGMSIINSLYYEESTCHRQVLHILIIFINYQALFLVNASLYPPTFGKVSRIIE